MIAIFLFYFRWSNCSLSERSIFIQKHFKKLNDSSRVVNTAKEREKKMCLTLVSARPWDLNISSALIMHFTSQRLQRENNHLPALHILLCRAQTTHKCKHSSSLVPARCTCLSSLSAVIRVILLTQKKTIQLNACIMPTAGPALLAWKCNCQSSWTARSHLFTQQPMLNLLF